MKQALLGGDRRRQAFWVLFLIGLVVMPARGLVIRTNDPARNDLFSSGYPDSPVANTNFFVRFYDFSGVGWNAGSPEFSYTMISPLHFIGANHVKPGVGATVNFQGRDGVVRSFTVANQYNTTNSAGLITDLFVGELNRPLTACDNITFYPILTLGADTNYLRQTLTVYGRTARVGRGTINSFQYITVPGAVNSTRAYKFIYLNASGSNDDCYFEGGDSGSPSFVATNGELFVVAIHTAVEVAGSEVDDFDTFVPFYLNQVDRILSQKGFHAATNANEVFWLCYQLTPLANNTCQISWIGHPGRVYQVERSTNLPAFFPISGLVTANVATVSYIDSNSVSRPKFYRVRRIDP